MSANVNYIMFSPDGRKNRQGQVTMTQSIKCKDSFVCVCLSFPKAWAVDVAFAFIIGTSIRMLSPPPPPPSQ